MGALSNIIAFDYKNYINLIIPALQKGESSQLVKDEIATHNANCTYEMPSFQNLKAVIELFNSDLSSCKYGKCFAVSPNNVLRTERKFQRPKDVIWTYEDLTTLFEPMILRHCAKYFLSVGKIYYLKILINSRERRSQELLKKWENGSEIWCHGSGGYAEGISGWLTNEDVIQLNERSDYIQLETDNYNSNGNVLKAIREIISIAARNNLGLIYGNDLSINLKPSFKYNQILSLKRVENENWDGDPVFETQIVKDYR